MLKRTRAAAVAASVPALLGATVMFAGTASADPSTVQQVNQDHPLISAKGLTLNADHQPVVAQGFFGQAAPVLTYQLKGKNAGTSTELTAPIALTDISAADGGYWAITSFSEEPEPSGSEARAEAAEEIPGLHLVWISKHGDIKD